jgi:asparagine synthase (glutamine-hydrolysing)
MCGIVGIVSSPGRSPPGADIAHEMNAAIRHRGPDDEGVYRDERALIGMRRLAIIDIEGGHQPMRSADGNIVLAFNGEVYNFRELRRELEALGRVFVTRSDAEAVLHAFAQWGENCFNHLHGMFAIAIWDRRERCLLLARDRFGEKPLFYFEDPGRLAFASELKALTRVPGFRGDLDAESIQAYVCFGYVPAPASIFGNVRKLPPGHYLRYAAGRSTIKRYWQIEFAPKLDLDEGAATEQLAFLLDQAVASRMVADVPFGAFLSGGIDSSTVVALMAQHSSYPVRTFSIGFREDAYSELADARRVAAHFGTEHHEEIVVADAVDLLEDLVWHLDEPFADASAVPTFLVSRLASRHVKMVLTGDGGDEAFAGYDRYAKFLRLHSLGALRPAAAAAAELAGRLLPDAHGYRLRRIGERLRKPYPDSYLSGVALTRADIAGRLIGEQADATHYRGLRSHAVRGASLPDVLDRVVAIDLASYLPDDILVKLDRMAMANSLEGRAPLLDHRLVEFAVRLPAHLRLRDGRGKYLLRKAASRWLPPTVLDKPKQGFAMPLNPWFRGPLRQLAADTFASRAFRERGLVRAPAARALLDAHVAGEADHGEVLWLVLCLELWARRFVDTPARAAAA